MMRAMVPSASSPEQTPYAAADAAFAEAQAFLSSRQAQQMSESELERELHRLGQDLMHKLLQGHREQRDSLAVAADRVQETVEETDEDDVIERSQGRVPEGPPETTTCARVQVARLTRASVVPRRRSTSRPPPCTTSTSRCGTAHHRPTGRHRDRRRMCPTAAGGIGALRAEVVLRLPLRASRDLDACWHSHEARSTGAFGRPATC